MRRLITCLTVAAIALVPATIIVPGLMSASSAADGTGSYGVWALDPANTATGSITFAGTIFPQAVVGSEGQNLSVARTATLSSSTPFGQAYGSSAGNTYLSVGLKAGFNRASVTITFEEPPVAGTYGLVMGDVDAENVILSATDAQGRPVSVREWNGTDFNYAGGTDLPRWDGSTGTITGNGTDTQGASMWIVPNTDVKTITLTQTRTAGFPAYQLWIAADVITPAPEPSPSPGATAVPVSPAGKVTICHRTRSAQNPYVEMTIDTDAVLRRGHDTHTGGVFPEPDWGDIIPPFPGYAGLNWPGGAAVLNNDCEVGGPEPIPSALQESESPSPSGSGSPTSSASPSATATGSTESSASASPSGSGTPEPTPVPTPTITVPPVDPTPVVVDPVDETVIPTENLIPEGGTVIDVIPPPGGSAEVTPGGDIVVTPAPGGGTQTVTLVVRENDGTVVAVPVRVRVAQKATACPPLPTALSVGQNVLPRSSGACRPVAARVTCTPLTRSATAGDVAFCRASVSRGRVVVTIAAGQPLRVRLDVTTKGKGDRPGAELTRTYLIRR